MFEGFRHEQIQTTDPEVKINLRYGGNGPAVLLLHGNPLTHVTWHIIAPLLAKDFTVVCADLRGYGDSSKPQGLPDHSNYSFRRMAQDQVDVMKVLGYEEFFVAGHDRGARTAFRMALDHPRKILKYAAVDIVPTYAVWSQMGMEKGMQLYHWFFMAQPYDFPEKLLSVNLEYYIKKKLEKHMHGQGGLEPETVAEYLRCATPEQIHSVCEDYRAAATIDYEMDKADFKAQRKIHCPVMVVWGDKSHVQISQPTEVWPQYAANIFDMCSVPAGHYPQQQAAKEVFEHLERFFKS